METLSEKIRERMLKTAPKNKEGQKKQMGRCRPLVLSLWEEITASIRDGWSLRNIWTILHEEGNFPGCYESFRRTVKKLQKDGGTISKADREESKSKEKPDGTPAMQDFSIKTPEWNSGSSGKKLI